MIRFQSMTGLALAGLLLAACGKKGESGDESQRGPTMQQPTGDPAPAASAPAGDTAGKPSPSGAQGNIGPETSGVGGGGSGTGGGDPRSSTGTNTHADTGGGGGSAGGGLGSKDETTGGAPGD